VRGIDIDEINGVAFRIDSSGDIDFPLVGKMHVGGLTVVRFKSELITRLKTVIREPAITVAVTEYGSHPVSVLGAVTKPGVYQVRGRKTLTEMLSMAEGLRPEAGNSIHLTRRKERGPIPLPGGALNATGEFHTAEVHVKSILEAKHPEENIVILADDVISVPRAKLVYVIGSVKKSGGFVLNERETVSVLQALALAEGLDHMAAPAKCRILRQFEGENKRVEIAVNLTRIMTAKSEDLALLPEDILFIPGNAARSATIRGLEAAIQIGTGLAIWRR
jgi:polysaccharide export outer membrane protein